MSLRGLLDNDTVSWDREHRRMQIQKKEFGLAHTQFEVWDVQEVKESCVWCPEIKKWICRPGNHDSKSFEYLTWVRETR